MVGLHEEIITSCRICAGMCSLRLARDTSGRIVSARGDKSNPLARGYACIKGLQLPAAALGIVTGQGITIESAHGRIEAFAEADDSIRPGVVSISHGWGGLPGDAPDAADPHCAGVNVNRLTTRAPIFSPSMPCRASRRCPYASPRCNVAASPHFNIIRRKQAHHEKSRHRFTAANRRRRLWRQPAAAARGPAGRHHPQSIDPTQRH